MSILARVIAVLGLILIVAAAIFLVKNVIDINQLYAVAYSNKSNNYPSSPVYNVIWTAGITLLGGLLAGVGLGMAMRRRQAALPK
jgi:Ca2+/Na+ antiporter